MSVSKSIIYSLFKNLGGMFCNVSEIYVWNANHCFSHFWHQDHISFNFYRLYIYLHVSVKSLKILWKSWNFISYICSVKLCTVALLLFYLGTSTPFGGGLGTTSASSNIFGTTQTAPSFSSSLFSTSTTTSSAFPTLGSNAPTTSAAASSFNFGIKFILLICVVSVFYVFVVRNF